MTLSPGRRLGPYEIMAPLGAGGMGEVYRARDGRLERDVAIKVLPDAVARDVLALSRFEREARAVAALNHPGILSLFDIGTEDGTAYAVLELLQGETLGERLARGALPVRKAVEHAAALAQALAAAHEKGIVHRDLKPDNIFLMADGRVKLLDFGLAAHRPPMGPSDDTSSPTLSRHTDPGTIEQVHSVPGTRPAEVARPARRWASSLTVMAVGLALFGGGLFLGRGLGVRPPPAFRQLTFQRARVGTARFTPDGQTVVYALAKGDQPLRVESSRLDSIESRALELPLPPADVLGVSRTGKLGLILDRKHRGTWISCGTLARVGLAGGTPREALEGVCEGDIAPDAASFAVVRQVGALQRLEYPIGHAVFETHAGSATCASLPTAAAWPSPIIPTTATMPVMSPSSRRTARCNA